MGAAKLRAGAHDGASPPCGVVRARHPVVKRVTLYSARGCHLCDRAREVLETARADSPFELEEIDITGDPALEAAHREWLPVVEVDGVRAFVYFVQPEALRRRLGAE